MKSSIYKSILFSTLILGGILIESNNVSTVSADELNISDSQNLSVDNISTKNDNYSSNNTSDVDTNNNYSSNTNTSDVNTNNNYSSNTNTSDVDTNNNYSSNTNTSDVNTNNNYSSNTNTSDVNANNNYSSNTNTSDANTDNAVVLFSKERGLYSTGFQLSLTSDPGLTIKYTLDGSDPNAVKNKGSFIYINPINVDKTMVVRAAVVGNKDNTSFVNTYILKDNLKNEKRSGSRWRYIKNINDNDYSTALSQCPIVSLTGNEKNLGPHTDSNGTFEYINPNNNNNIIASSINSKYGQVSASQFNSGIKIKFPEKLKYDMFEKSPVDTYTPAKKFKELKLKEGEDGPQSDKWGLGYNRYDEQVTKYLEKSMGKFAVNTKYVNYFYNGNYMGLKTLKEDFKPEIFAQYFGGKKSDYTRVRFQDSSYSSGKFTNGDVNVWNNINNGIKNKDFQSLKKYVDIDDLVKTQILYMMIDTEREVDGVVKNDILTNPDSIKMKFTINDTDGAFANNKKTGTKSSAFAGGGGTYRHKWNSDAKSVYGPAKLFSTFAGLKFKKASSANLGNLEFTTIIKDEVLNQLGTGDINSSTYTLSENRINNVIKQNISELQPLYKLDAAFMGAHSNMYDRWNNMQENILKQTADRISYSLSMWKYYGLMHNLGKVLQNINNDGISLNIPDKNISVYYTEDGTDPMGPNGIISTKARLYSPETKLSTGSTITAREFAPNDWGPKSIINL